jgi:hypothetical protein
MNPKRKTIVLLAVAALVIATLACGSNNTGSKVGESNTGSATTAPSVQVYKVGEIVQVSDQTIVLNSATVNGSTLKANFTVENKGSDDLALSSMLSFSAKNGDGAKLEQDIFECGPQLDGKVLPGDKVKGDICYKGATSFPVRLYYQASLLGSGAVVWEVSK